MRSHVFDPVARPERGRPASPETSTYSEVPAGGEQCELVASMSAPSDSAAAAQVLDLQQIPIMETVSSGEYLDNLESDDELAATEPSDDSPTVPSSDSKISKPDIGLRKPTLASHTPAGETTRPTRRTRGMSFLPVRQSPNTMTPNLTSPMASSPPPTTPSPLRPPPYANSNSSRRSSEGNGNRATTGLSQPGTPVASGDDNGGLLVAYMNQLAAKEAQVVDLRNTINRLQVELKDAESDLSAYKDNGKKLAELVNSGESHKDVLGMGRRVVDEIGTQFWGFLDDVKKATMGSNDFPSQGHSAQAQGSHAAPVPEPIPRSPSPHRQISPKRSIQDFLKNRPRSPIRRVRPPSPERQRVAEQHASQRLRESQRLSKKLSQLDLRAPSPSRELRDNHNYDAAGA